MDKSEAQNIIQLHISSYLKENPLPENVTPEELEEIFNEIGKYFLQTNKIYDEDFASQIKYYENKKNLILKFSNYNIDLEVQKKVLQLLKITNHFCIIPFKKYDSTDFSNGHYYIEHNPRELNLVLEKVLTVCYENFPDIHKKAVEALNSKNIKSIYDPRIIDYTYRVISEGHFSTTMNKVEQSVLISFLEKLSRIDFNLNREQGQTYFRNNPKEVTLCINPGASEKMDADILKKTNQINKKTNIKKTIL